MVGFPKKGESYYLLKATIASTLIHKMIKLGLPIRDVTSCCYSICMNTEYVISVNVNYPDIPKYQTCIPNSILNWLTYNGEWSYKQPPAGNNHMRTSKPVV